jgi:cardiolipin synthase
MMFQEENSLVLCFLLCIRARLQSCINLEFYEFRPGEVGDSILEALTERVRAGVEVRMIVDALGSFHTHRSLFAPLVAVGGRMHFYHRVSWKTWQHANNRTHRKLLVVDGELGFIGGAGVADHWIRRTKTGPAWRDTVFQVEGEAVAGLTSTFAENWLEASGEILCSPEHFAYKSFPQASKSFVVSSTPNDGGTRARVLFQALINSARHSIIITTPYFLPDRSARQALIEAVRDRGVKVRILTAGPLIDHPTVRMLSRHSSRHLLNAGAEIHEYQPSMIHAKLLTVDGQWSVVGSTNFDHRSFALNDEVNLAIFDRDIAQTIAADFAEDLQQSRRLTLAMLDQRVLGDILRPITHALKQES